MPHTIEDIEALGAVGLLAALEEADAKVAASKDRARSARARVRHKLGKRISRVIADLEIELTDPVVLTATRKAVGRIIAIVDGIDQDDESEE